MGKYVKPMEKQIICAAATYLYTSWSSDQNSVEWTMKVKSMFLQSTQENKILKSGSRVGLKKNYTVKIF